MSTTTARETSEAALVRLAAQARRLGVQLLTAPSTNEVYATSVSHPGWLHRITALSCTCAGFLRHQRCMHHAYLLAHLGWLPAAPVPCAECRGRGWMWVGDDYHPPVQTSCPTCQGTGEVSVAPPTVTPIASAMVA